MSTLTRDVVNRDDPAQRAVLAAERIRALEELELMRKQIVADTDAIAAIDASKRCQRRPRKAERAVVVVLEPIASPVRH